MTTREAIAHQINDMIGWTRKNSRAAWRAAWRRPSNEDENFSNWGSDDNAMTQK